VQSTSIERFIDPLADNPWIFCTWQVTKKSELDLLDAVSMAPVAVSVDGSALAQYKSGILSGHCAPYPDLHAMLVVGYGTENGVDYWNLKNSYGSTWGENGYMRVMRNDSKCKNYGTGAVSTSSWTRPTPLWLLLVAGRRRAAPTRKGKPQNAAGSARQGGARWHMYGGVFLTSHTRYTTHRAFPELSTTTPYPISAPKPPPPRPTLNALESLLASWFMHNRMPSPIPPAGVCSKHTDPEFLCRRSGNAGARKLVSRLFATAGHHGMAR
jgi:hypothetical protein